MTRPGDEFGDPEQSYRRGYAQGSWDILDAVKGLISPSDYAALEKWHTKQVWTWRIKGLQGESVRAEGINPFPPGVRPPREKLPKLGRTSN